MSAQLNFRTADSGEAPADLVARFELDGEPQSKARRSAKRGNKIITYSPQSNKIAESEVRSAYLEVTRKVERDDKAFAVRAVDDDHSTATGRGQHAQAHPGRPQRGCMG